MEENSLKHNKKGWKKLPKCKGSKKKPVNHIKKPLFHLQQLQKTASSLFFSLIK